MNKKSVIITILGIIIVLLFTMYITSNAESYSIGQIAEFGMGFPGNENFKGNLMNPEQFDYFCAKKGNAFTSNSEEYNKAIKFENIAKAEIIGDTITVTTKSANEETYTETQTNDNKQLALLYYKIKDGKEEITKYDYSKVIYKQVPERDNIYHWTHIPSENDDKVHEDGGTVLITRNRGHGTNPWEYGFIFDFGQHGMWRALKDWNANVASKISDGAWQGIAASLQNEDVKNDIYRIYYNDTKQATIAYLNGKHLYEEVIEEVEQAIDNEYGIEESYYKNSSSDKKVETRIDKDATTILGPFQYNFVGKIKNGKPTLTFNKTTKAQEYTIGTYQGSKFTETNKIVSGNKFYIKVPTSSLIGVTDIHFNFQIEGISLYNTKTTLYFFDRVSKDDIKKQYQPVMHIEQEEGYNEPFKDSYKISKSVETSLEKKDESGNALKAEGIKFQIKDETNKVVAYFMTDSNGNGIVTDSKWKSTGKKEIKLLTNQTYTLVEISNNIYGYKGINLLADKIQITGAQIKQDGKNIKFTLNPDCKDKVTIKVKNIKELANLEIEKLGENKTKLENVAFVIEIDSNKYLQLKDSNGKVVTSAKGVATINTNNKANSNEYKVEYVSNEASATKFVTNANGKVAINKLELNKSKTEKYSYTVYEVYNPNHGYGSKNNLSQVEAITSLELNKTTQIKFTNTQDLGNLRLEKYDEDKTDLKLENVGFVIEISPALEKEHAYLALYDKDGKLVPSIKGTVTINSQNKATANGKEYKVSYYNTNEAISELSDEEKANLKAKITTFVTNSEGNLKVNNLEVYSPKTGGKYKYKLIETSNSNYGFIADSVELGNIELETNKTSNQKIGNKQAYTKISGYVWIEEKPEGKGSHYDYVYTDGDASNDVRLTDLYIKENGKLIKNPAVVTPVEIKLRDKTTGKFVRDLPDEFDATGKYTFVDIEVAKLSNYEVVFIYDGFYYTTIVEKLDKDNGSKVKENANERTALNNKFATVNPNSQVVAEDGTQNTVEYYKDGHTSVLSNINFDTNISASTTINENEYNLKTKFDDAKANSEGHTEEIENVNMGIVLREQPDLSIGSDINSVLVEVDDYRYTYYYNGRQQHYEMENDDKVGVKFEEEKAKSRYTQPIYSSDIEALDKGMTEKMSVSVIYKISISNKSATLKTTVHEIANYFDADYTIKTIKLKYKDANGKEIIEEIPKASWENNITTGIEVTAGEGVTLNSDKGYNCVRIPLGENGISLEAQKSKEVYIEFEVSTTAIKGLLTGESTYHNATEIMSYSTYYGKNTGISDGKKYITEQVKEGTRYAGIDEDSQPGNIKLELINDSREQGVTPILNTNNFEDDSTSAPSLLLQATEARKITGTIWEDTDNIKDDDQKIGNGIYDSGEKPIAGVQVELLSVKEDGTIGKIAKYSNGEEIRTTTNEVGSYTFGYYDEDKKEHVGIIPGRYVVRYTYNNESYIVDANGKKNINVNDYKSTIISSEVVERAFNGENERWYLIKEANRYSDARDNISLRPEYNPEVDKTITVTNSTYNNTLAINKMEAYTPIMDIGIEFTDKDEAEILTLNLEKEFNNIDFGIIERPNVDISIQKEITGLEIMAQNGANIIPKGDPSNPESEMQYVKTGLDGIVPVEIESKLLQSAKLNVEYTITVINNSDKDYAEEEYYYYGRIPEGAVESTSKVKQVVDYLDATMVLEEELNSGNWTEKKPEDLYNTETKTGLVSEEVYNELKNGNYHILTTESFEEVSAGSEKSVKLYATKALAISDNIREENKVEIIEITGKRSIRDSIPGNYNPSKKPSEQNEDEVDLVITPPTGTTVNYMLYIIAGGATFVILLLGIVIIKKKLVK